MRSLTPAFACVVVLSGSALSSRPSAIRHARPHRHPHVHTGQPTGAYPPIWNYFGADEPNYTYAPDGKRLVG